MQALGRTMMVLGALIVLLGVLLCLWEKIPFLGKLPLDLKIERKGFVVYLPIGSCILLSLILTLVFWLLGKR